MRHNSIGALLVGQIKFSSDEKNSAKLLNICMRSRIVYRDLTTYGGRVELWCSPYMSYILVSECKKAGVELKKEAERGLPTFLLRYRSRVGLLIGAILASLIIAASDDYIWDIRLEGNERVTYTELVETLRECGLYAGSRISELDVDEIETQTILSCPDISWIAVNIIGTHANVEIREVGERPLKKEEIKPSNLVAARDGVIDRVELFSGNPAVRAGDVVRAGDILASGVWDSNHYGFFVTRSSGKVYARTTRHFTVEIPLEYEKKTPNGRETASKYLIFFSKEIKLFEKGGNVGASCDTIEREDTVRLFSEARLPIGIRREERIYYSTEVCRYTENEAMELAYFKMARLIEASIGDGDVLKKAFEYEITDERYILHCTLTAIEDIALVREFEFDSKQ